MILRRLRLFAMFEVAPLRGVMGEATRRYRVTVLTSSH
jgi:hypothetical protein